MSSTPPYPEFDQQQFEQLFRAHFEYLCNYALQYVEDMDTAQEICQKVFIRLWEKRAEMDPQQSIKSYLFTSVRNRCLNYIRDNKKYRSSVLDLDCGEFDLAGEEDNYASEDLQQRVAAALNELPEKCRLVFEMSRFQGLKYREIAEELDISQKTVEAHMSKAMKMLRERLQDYFMLFILFLDHFK
ncbi:MAG: RNA polymerase sigma-70 factor [Bacteroidota bacterium]